MDFNRPSLVASDRDGSVSNMANGVDRKAIAYFLRMTKKREREKFVDRPVLFCFNPFVYQFFATGTAPPPLSRPLFLPVYRL